MQIFIEDTEGMSEEEIEAVMARAASSYDLMNRHRELVRAEAAPHHPDDCTMSRGGILICGACEQARRWLR